MDEWPQLLGGGHWLDWLDPGVDHAVNMVVDATFVNRDRKM